MGEVSVEIRCTVKPYENYCKTGENMAAGHIAVAGGTLIRPIHMGLLAAAGPDGADGIDTDGKVSTVFIGSAPDRELSDLYCALGWGA